MYVLDFRRGVAIEVLREGRDSFSRKTGYRRRKMSATFIYMTAGSLDEAKKIGKELVSGRLAACVNIIEHMSSLYWWEGSIHEDNEVVMIAKTRETLVPELVEKVKSMHRDSCPCIVSLPVLGGNQEFLNWIAKETREGSRA